MKTYSFVLFVALFFLLSLVIFSVSVSARQGCCSWHDGVCGCRCCDGTPLSDKCAPYYPSCDKPSPPPCVPSCACASSTCTGNTCSNGCGGMCSGILDCTPKVETPPREPDPPPPEPEPEPIKEEVKGADVVEQERAKQVEVEDTSCSSIFWIGGLVGVVGVLRKIMKEIS